MSRLPRLALGTIQSEADAAPILWGLVDLLKRAGRQVQLFRDQARFVPGEGGQQVCGQNTRYLDSWMMSRPLCRESFAHGSRGSELSVVAGKYAEPESSPLAMENSGGDLSTLSHWLRLPRLVVVDVVSLDHCRLPARPTGAAGILLDRVSTADFPRWQTTLEALWGIPVLAGMPAVPALRQVLAAPDSSELTPCQLCKKFGTLLSYTARVPRLLEIAGAACDLPVEHVIFQPGAKLSGQTVAVAYDDALNAYFPDVLDLLEMQGAEVVDFSLLRDEGLPARTDIVYLGCGQPQRYAAELMDNHCMLTALRNHACRGGRIYAEGAGLSYLCQEIRLPDGQSHPMAGIWPAAAVFQPQGAARPVEVTLSRDHWLGRQGMTLRGYENPSWRIDAATPSEVIARTRNGQPMLAGQGRAVVSQLHIDFAAQPDFLECFTTAATSLAADPAPKQQ